MLSYARYLHQDSGQIFVFPFCFVFTETVKMCVLVVEAVVFLVEGFHWHLKLHCSDLQRQTLNSLNSAGGDQKQRPGDFFWLPCCDTVWPFCVSDFIGSTTQKWNNYFFHDDRQWSCLDVNIRKRPTNFY